MILVFAILLREGDVPWGGGDFPNDFQRDNRRPAPWNPKHLEGYHKLRPSPFKNAYQAADGSFQCFPGFISDGPVDARGCWRCNRTCPRSAVCAYPGICLVPVPIIQSIEIRKEQFVVGFRVHRRDDFEPVEVFCRYGTEGVMNAVSVSRDSATCPPSRYLADEFAKSQLQISFDGHTWSGRFGEEKNDGGDEETTWNVPAIILAVIVVAAVIGLVVVLVRRRGSPAAPRKIDMIEQNMPMAFFPQVREGATPKYNEMMIDPHRNT